MVLIGRDIKVLSCHYLDALSPNDMAFEADACKRACASSRSLGVEVSEV